jgi:hypothetical protein
MEVPRLIITEARGQTPMLGMRSVCPFASIVGKSARHNSGLSFAKALWPLPRERDRDLLESASRAYQAQSLMRLFSFKVLLKDFF